MGSLRLIGLAVLSTFAVTTTVHAQRVAVATALGYELEGAAIPSAQLDALPNRVRETLARCGNEALPLVGGVLRARLPVAPNGRVSGATLEGEAAGEPERAGRTCITGALETLRFPARRTASTLILELSFAARGQEGDDPRTLAYRQNLTRAFERNQPAVHSCFERSRSANESPGSNVSVEYTIAPDGRVTRAALPTGDLFPRLAECLRAEMLRWQVPRPTAGEFRGTHRFSGDIAAYD